MNFLGNYPHKLKCFADVWKNISEHFGVVQSEGFPLDILFYQGWEQNWTLHVEPHYDLCKYVV